MYNNYNYIIIIKKICNRFGGYIALPGFVVGNVKVNGIHISYIDRNPSSKKQNSTDSCPSVVFIHGLTSQKLSWAPVVRSLPKTWRIVAIDLPGHGKSGFNMEHNYNVVNMGELLHEVSHYNALQCFILLSSL